MLGLLRKYDGRGIGLIVGGVLLVVGSLLFANGYKPNWDLWTNLRKMELDFSTCDKYFSQFERKEKNANQRGFIDYFMYETNDCAGGVYISLRYCLLIGFSFIGMGVYVRMTDLK